MKLLYSFYGPVKKIRDITNPFSADWKWDNNVNPDQELQVGKPLQLPQFTMAVIREITKKKLSLTQSSERNVNTKIPWDATTPLHPVLPTVTAEIPIVTTAREPSIMAPRSCIRP